MDTHTHTRAPRTNIHTHTHTHAHTITQSQSHTHNHTHTQSHTRTHTRTDPHLHTHTHAQARKEFAKERAELESKLKKEVDSARTQATTAVDSRIADYQRMLGLGQTGAHTHTHPELARRVLY